MLALLLFPVLFKSKNPKSIQALQQIQQHNPQTKGLMLVHLHCSLREPYN